mmetsp:Transcript_5102/g.8860  ORF Transcript_5102/g.8860 Transcript_5102/m.8860 type:complete len:209 (+) Transcript_5102:337-963(+)
MPYRDASRRNTGRRDAGSAHAPASAKLSAQNRSVYAQPMSTATSMLASNTAAAAASADFLEVPLLAATAMARAICCVSACSLKRSRADRWPRGRGPGGAEATRDKGQTAGALVSARSSRQARATCCIITVLAPSNVTSTFMSLASSPILLMERKPMPPQHSRHACSASTRLQVAAALRPLLSTWMALPSLGFLRATISFSVRCAICRA